MMLGWGEGGGVEVDKGVALCWDELLGELPRKFGF